MHVELIFFTKSTLPREIRELFDYNRSYALLLLFFNQIHPSQKNHVIGVITMYILGNNIWPAMRFPRFTSNLFMFSHAFHFCSRTNYTLVYGVIYLNNYTIILFIYILTYISNICELFSLRNRLRFRNLKLWSTIKSVYINLKFVLIKNAFIQYPGKKYIKIQK